MNLKQIVILKVAAMVLLIIVGALISSLSPEGYEAETKAICFGILLPFSSFIIFFPKRLLQ